MPPFHHPLLGALLRGSLAAALAACCVALAFWPGPDDRTDPPAQHTDDGADLCRQALRRAIEKQRLAAEVVEGRLSLVGAAARFRDLNAGEPAFNWEALRTTYPGCSDDERHCREVLSFVRGELRDRPGADPALAERLEAELHDLSGRGDLHLPGPRPAVEAP